MSLELHQTMLQSRQSTNDNEVVISSMIGKLPRKGGFPYIACGVRYMGKKAV